MMDVKRRFRHASKRKFTKGLFLTSSMMTKSGTKIAARIAQFRMKGLPNQSFRWPSSSIATSEPSPTRHTKNSPPIPAAKLFELHAFFSNAIQDRDQHKRTGNDVDIKVPFHPKWSVSQPPSAGPMAGARVAVIPNIA